MKHPHFALPLVMLVLQSCGGGGGMSTGQLPPAIESIQVSPTDVASAAGTTHPFTATAIRSARHFEHDRKLHGGSNHRNARVRARIHRADGNDGNTGALTQVAGSPFPVGANPLSASVDASGQYLYVGNADSNDVSAYVIDTDTGSLPPVPASPFPSGILPRDLAGDPSGRFVYVTNFGSQDVTVFSIDGGTGELSRVQAVPTGGNAISLDISEQAS